MCMLVAELFCWLLCFKANSVVYDCYCTVLFERGFRLLVCCIMWLVFIVRSAFCGGWFGLLC